MKQAVKFLFGSVVTYVVIAACSGGGRQKATPGKSGEGTGGMVSATDATTVGGSGGMEAAVGGPSGTEGASTEGASMVGSVGGNEAADTAMMATITGAVTDPVPDAQADPAESGSRLKARYLAGDDGSRSFVGWYDSERGENCTFYPASDGRPRCLPDGFFNALGGTYYLDSGCSQPLFMTTLTCATVKYGYTYSANGCTTAYTVYELTSVAPSTMYALSGGECTALDASTTAQWHTGVAISPSAFVAGTEEIDE